MRRSFLLTLLAFSVVVATAQDKGVTWTPTVGVGFSNWNNSNEMNHVSKPGTAFRVGMAIGIPLGKVMSIQTGAYFMPLNVKARTMFVDPAVTRRHRYEVQQNYFDVPLQIGARFNITEGCKLLTKVGGYASVGAGGKSQIRDVNDDRRRTFSKDGVGMRRFDAGLGMEVDVEIHRFVVGVEARMGLVQLKKDYDVYNYCGMLTFGYRINGLGKKHKAAKEK